MAPYEEVAPELSERDLARLQEGGLPVVLAPLEEAGVAPLVEQLAGICLSGGPDIPVLGICRGPQDLDVNAFYHQAVDRPGRGLRPVAWADDGIVEAIEGDGEALYLGVQWHVETLVHMPRHMRLFDALVDAASGRRSERQAA
jgi:gamma-glutamyl-gamma-aminobutyrate hydrolase PuuD